MSFPALYQAHQGHYLEDLPFWLDLASRFSGPLLELGCGTGRVLIPLAEMNISVVGLDYDLGMLNLLQKRLPIDVAQRVALIQADFTAFHLAASFGLVILTCNTYTTLSSLQRRKTLERVINHLQPTGCFAVSLPNPALLRSLSRQSEPEVEEIFPHPADCEPVQVSSEWRRDSTKFHLKWHYDHLLPQGIVERMSVPLTHHLVAVEELQQEFTRAGFRDLQMYGDFAGSPFKDSSSILIILARL